MAAGSSSGEGAARALVLGEHRHLEPTTFALPEGVIDAAGPAAAERWSVKVGDRVAVEVFLSCRECDPCRAGQYRRCVRHGVNHFYGFISSDERPGLWGGYATHLYLHPDALLLPVPASLDPVVAHRLQPIGAGIREHRRHHRWPSPSRSSTSTPSGRRRCCTSGAARGVGSRPGHRHHRLTVGP